jgi:hypothetical protein
MERAQAADSRNEDLARTTQAQRKSYLPVFLRQLKLKTSDEMSAGRFRFIIGMLYF